MLDKVKAKEFLDIGMKVIKNIAIQYPSVPYKQEPSNDYLLYKLEEIATSNKLNLKGGPGYFHCYAGASNFEVLSRYYPFVVSAAFKRLILLRDTPYEVVSKLSSIELFERGLCSVHRVMIKDEPHSASKVAEGRFRVVISESLEDQLADRVLLGDVQDANISNWNKIPAKCGMGFAPADVSTITNMFKEVAARNPKIKGLRACDVRCWDWSVEDWLQQVNVERIRIQTQASPSWTNMLKNMAHVNMFAPLATSGGDVIIKDVAHGESSGIFNTSDGNSCMRATLPAIARWLAGRPTYGWIATMGDDSVEENDFEVDYKMFNLEITDDYRYRINEPVSFCSHKMSGDRAVPENWPKTVFRMFNQSNSDVTHEDYIAALEQLDGSTGVHFTQVLDFISVLGLK